MPPRFCIVVPGIRTDLPRLEQWGEPFRAVLMATGRYADVQLYDHGYFGAIQWRLGERMRKRQVGRLQGFVAALRQRVGSEMFVDVVAHSAGTWLTGHAMSDGPGPRAFFDRVVLWASILSSRDDWTDKAGHYSRALNLYSGSDQVVEFSTFGQSGWKGFACAPSTMPGVVENEPMVKPDGAGYEHGDYLAPGTGWDLSTAFLNPAAPAVAA